jgi:hypothetical protein
LNEIWPYEKIRNDLRENEMEDQLRVTGYNKSTSIQMEQGKF